ncbi:hypothetical protein RHECNPAF_4310021 [Rhizobium etli CNPAF512]|nr:hypothetical protein RHECNPAF_4310021 [Rhizobium etli CNPAF512]
MKEGLHLRHLPCPPLQKAERIGKIQAMVLAQRFDLPRAHPPVERFAERIKRQRPRTALAMRKHRPLGLRHRRLEGDDIGLGDLGALHRHEAVGKARGDRSRLFRRIARLAGIFAVRPGIDDAGKATHREIGKIRGLGLTRHRYQLIDPHECHRSPAPSASSRSHVF